MKIVYYAHPGENPHAPGSPIAEHGAAQSTACSAPFLSGEAGLVWVTDDGYVETDSRVAIAPNSLHSLYAHGVVDQLNELKLSLGRVGEQRDAIVAPSDVSAARRIFYAADRKTYGVEHDLLIAEEPAPRATQYRLLVNNREYQQTLSRLQFLAGTAARMGEGLRIRV